VLALRKKIAAAPPWEVVGQGASQGLASVVATRLLNTRMLASSGPTRSAMTTAVVAGLAAVLAVPLLGEPLAATAVIGWLFVTIGMIVGVMRTR